jgi:AAA15 family ATPase/GTPase
MLLRFGCSNMRSIRDYQQLSLSAASLRDPGVDLLQKRHLDVRVLPSVAIYGANAAGKSNLLAALRFMRNGVLRSHSRDSDEKKIGRRTFGLDSKFKKLPSKVDIDFVIDDFRHHYGFSVNDEQVLEEWLYSYPLEKSRRARQTWFHRKRGEKTPYYFGKELRGKNKTIEALTRDDALFLSTASQNNHPQLQKVANFFTDKLMFRDREYDPVGSEVAKYLQKPATRKRVLEFLRCADTGLTDAEVKKIKPDKKMDEFSKQLRSLLEKYTSANMKEVSEGFFNVRLMHRGSGKESVPFDLAEESKGTVALLGILGPAFDALENEKVLIVDELNTHIHSLASRELIHLFGSKKTNKGGGQLLFATHDTNLLTRGVLRRDQIWFAEKGREGNTVLYPLTDIKTRQTDNIEKGYLQGRFGAVPFFGAHELP